MKAVFSFFILVYSLAGLQAQKPRLVTPIGHTSFMGRVSSVAFSPDGNNVLTGGDDKTAKLWDLSGRELQTFKGHAAEVLSVAFSPDGKTILTGSMDKTARLWDLSGHELKTFKGHNASVKSVVFSPDGKTILTGSWDNTAKLWDLSGLELMTFNGHNAFVNSIAFSPDGKTILTGGMDKTAKLWDLSGRELQTFKGNTAEILSVAFSPDGKTMLIGSGDYTARLWDLSGRELQTFKGNDIYITSVALSPDGKSILTGNSDNTAKLWDLSGRELQTFQGHAAEVFLVTFSPDGKSVLTGSLDNTVKLWDVSGRELQTFKGHVHQVTSVAFSPDGKSVLAGSWDKTARLWDLTGRELQTFQGHTSAVLSVAFSSDGKSVMTGSFDETAKLWDVSGLELQTFKGHAHQVTSVAFSPDGKTVLTGSNDKTAKLWDLSGRELQTFQGHASLVWSVAFSPDGKTVLTGSINNTAKLWDLSGRELQTFQGHASDARSVAFSPDGKTVLTGSRKTAKLWDMWGRELQTCKGHAGDISSVAFSPDGKSILTGSDDNTAKLWDVSGHELQTFEGHDSSIESVAFSPDGKTILTGSEDNTTKLWSTSTGQNLATLIAVDSTDWVVTTPSGLFDASPGAMKLMHYVVGLDVIELDQLKERYYEPGLLAKIMGFDKGELRDVSTFDFVALYPEIESSIEKDRLAVQLTERNGGIGKLSLFINGIERQEDINPGRLKNLSLDLNTFSKYFLADTANEIALRVYNAEGWLKSQAYELEFRPATTDKPARRTIPHFYALVVGTSDYAGDRLDLRFADQDAAAMAGAFRSTGRALFGTERTSVRLLSTASGIVGKDANNGNEGTPDGIASKTNIQKAFADIAAKAQPEDVLVVYFSGHGLAYGPAEKEQFYYLTKDIGSEDLSDPLVRDNYTISSNEFTQWLTVDILAEKRVMILDACNAGKVVESLATIAQKALDPSQIRALDRMKDRTGMFILTGSAADKVSYEASQYGQGLLTYSLLQGMSGLALTEDKRVDVMTLFQYSRDQVPVLAKGIGGVQTPVLAFPTDGASFDIGIVTPQVKINVAQIKPVFIRNVFQDEDSFDDVLGLTNALDNYLRNLTTKGAQAQLIFWDVKEYENAFSMKGRYSIKGDAVEVRGRLFKGKDSQGEFQVTGKKSDVPGLVEAIMREVKGMIR